MAGWTKLFSSIVTSSVWCESHATVRVWVAMLATASADGVVEGSVPGFANLARVSVEEMRAAIETLSGPDPDSRTPAHDGRRIEVLEGGWRILNYAAYRERGQAKEGSRAPYFREYRKRKAQQPRNASDVARNTEERGEKREAEQRTDMSGRSATSAAPAARGAVGRIFDAWRTTMGKPQARLSPKRERLVRARLREFTEEQIVRAIDGCKASPFHMGENDRGQRYDDLTLICRSPEKVEAFLELAGAAEAPAASSGGVPKTPEELAAYAADWRRRNGMPA